MKTTFIVVNYNGERSIERCLGAILNQSHRGFHILVIDNNSNDGSIEMIRRIKADSSADIELIINKENLGFAKAVNRGIEVASSKYIALVNNDAILKNNWLEKMVNAAREDDKAGMFASKIYFMNGILNSVGHAVYRGFAVMERGWFEKDEGQYDHSVYVPGACAAAAFYRNELFDDIGLFDEDYFMYNEDVDLSLRALLMGWRIRYVPEAIAYHIHSASTGFLSDFSVYYNSRNWVWSYLKNVPSPIFWKEFPWFLLRNFTSLVYFCAKGKTKAILKSKIDALRGLRTTLSKRKEIQGKTGDKKEIEKYLNGFGFKSIKKCLDT